MYSQIRNISIACIIIVALGGFFQTATADIEANKAIVQRMIDEVMNQQNLDVIDELFAADYLMHDPAWPMEVKGPEGFKQWAGAMLDPYFSDSRITIEDMIAEGDKVAVRWTWSGTHTGEFMGVPPTGRQIAVTGISIHRFADGEFVESWASYDSLGMMQQITLQTIPEGLVMDQITSPALEGNLLGDPAMRNMVIYLPSGYESSEQAYPVVYLMPGLGATERWWACGEFSPAFNLMGIALQNLPEAGFASMIDGLITDGKMQPMIIVMPDMSTAYGGSFCVNSALNGNHEDYIVNDIVPYIDANYRTLPSRNSRA